MRVCPDCGTPMVRWGHGRTERWRCPPCGQKRRKKRHAVIGDKFRAPRQATPEPTVVIEDSDMTLYHGDCLEVLAALPEQSVQMCATSPPFHGLRDYGVDGQIGLEETPDEWCDRLVEVFSEVRRVLRDDGTLWIEIGDSFDKKQLVGQPWLLAFALRSDGWYLRSEIIWSKPNAMPESITDRPTKSHSTVFLLSKNPNYYYDQDAIRQPFTDGNRGAGQGFRWNSPHYTEQDGPLDNTLGGLPPEAPRGPDGRRVTAVKGKENSVQHRDGERWPNADGANARTVWTVATEPTPFAHFATWPKKLVSRMIQAGTPEKGCCPECGAPWTRTTRTDGEWEAQHDRVGKYDDARIPRYRRNPGGGLKGPNTTTRQVDLGWSPSCDHGHQPVPATVLDPFAGSGTTLAVARSLGRNSVGIELSGEYIKLAAERTQQLSLLG